MSRTFHHSAYERRQTRANTRGARLTRLAVERANERRELIALHREGATDRLRRAFS